MNVGKFYAEDLPLRRGINQEVDFLTTPVYERCDAQPTKLHSYRRHHDGTLPPSGVFARAGSPPSHLVREGLFLRG